MKARATYLRRRSLSALVALALAAPVTVIWAEPAMAADCSGGNQSDVFDAVCDVGGSTGGGSLPYTPARPGATWHIIEDYDQALVCTNRLNQISYEALMYATWGPNPNDPIAEGPGVHCLVRRDAGTANNDEMIARAKVAVPKPVLSVDYKSDFLTGAPIQFGMTQPGTLQARVPGFPAWVEARPTGYEWDFGDGTTSTDPSPVHIYETKSPDPANPESHQVTVSLRITYQGFLHLDSADINGSTPPQDLGTLELEAQEQRTIIEVWSALTERK